MATIARLPKQLGAEIRKERKRQGLTQKQLGEQTRIRQATISQLESGEAGAQLDTVLRILSALNMELVVRERTSADWDTIPGMSDHG
jgi:HTH-type transcriptional regulator/antitoxin HipB